MHTIVQSLWGRVCRGARADTRGLNLWRACLTVLVLGGCTEAEVLKIPVVYVVAGRVLDPATSPVLGIAGARVFVDTAPDVTPVTSDADGNFVLQGVPNGVHRLRVELAGRRGVLSGETLLKARLTCRRVSLAVEPADLMDGLAG